MEKDVRTFIAALNEREDILQLIKDAQFHLSLHCGNQKVKMWFHNGNVSLQENEGEWLPHYELSAEQEVLKELLEGKETLRVLLRKKRLTLTAPFRVVLLLESIFYLTKASSRMQKII